MKLNRIDGSLVKTSEFGAEIRLMRMSVGWKATRVFEREMASRGFGHSTDSVLQVSLHPDSVGLLMSSPCSTGESFATLTQPRPVRHAQAQGDSWLLYQRNTCIFRKYNLDVSDMIYSHTIFFSHTPNSDYVAFESFDQKGWIEIGLNKEFIDTEMIVSYPGWRCPTASWAITPSAMKSNPMKKRNFRSISSIQWSQDVCS